MTNPNASGTKVEWEGPGHYWFNPLVGCWIKIQDPDMVETIAKFRPVRELTAADVREQVCLVEITAAGQDNSEVVKLYTTLVGLGYNASLCNADCFDIRQDGLIHYLSLNEAKSLVGATLPHPVPLLNYADRNGLNYWYDFEAREGGLS